MLPYIIIMLCLTGAMYPALDLTAGEKERGTMETILCCPVGRTDLVLGKFLMVLTASLGTVLLSLLSMGATFHFARRAMAGSLPREALQTAATIDLGGVAGVFLMLLPVAVMFSALLLMVGLFSKSFREAQSYCGPLMLVRGRAHGGRDAARGGTQRLVCRGAPVECQPRVQGNDCRHLALELHPAHLRVGLRICHRGAGRDGMDVPPRRGVVPVLKGGKTNAKGPRKRPGLTKWVAIKAFCRKRSPGRALRRARKT